TGWSGIGKTFALRSRNPLPPLLAHARYELLLDVEGNHRDAVEASKLEQWHVERRIIAPDLSPFGRLQESLIGQLAVDPIAQNRLQATGKGFEANDNISATAMQRCERMQLPAMVIRIGMGFSQQHDWRLGSEIAKQVSPVNGLSRL